MWGGAHCSESIMWTLKSVYDYDTTSSSLFPFPVPFSLVDNTLELHCQIVSVISIQLCSSKI